MSVVVLGSRFSLSIVPPWLLFFLIAWLFFVGGSIGSFLNVVIYRLPRRMSVSYPRSRCPVCLSAIKWYDNMPVISWCLLGGRCRRCAAPISARYVFVELLVAILFVGFALAEVFGNGANLPEGIRSRRIDMVALCTIYGMHMLLFVCLVAATYMAYDYSRIPLRLFFVVFLPCCVAMMFWRDLHVVDSSFVSREHPLFGVVNTSVGAAGGLLIGILASIGVAGAQRGGVVGMFGLIGVVLGWQAALVIGSLSLWLMVLNTAFARAGLFRREWPWPVFPLLLSTAYVGLWRQLGNWLPQLVNS